MWKVITTKTFFSAKAAKPFLWCHDAVAITNAQLHSIKCGLRFYACSSPACNMLEICNGEILWQWSRLLSILLLVIHSAIYHHLFWETFSTILFVKLYSGETRWFWSHFFKILVEFLDSLVNLKRSMSRFTFKKSRTLVVIVPINGKIRNNVLTNEALKTSDSEGFFDILTRSGILW